MDTKTIFKNFTRHQPCGGDFIRGGPVIAELRTVQWLSPPDRTARAILHPSPQRPGTTTLVTRGAQPHRPPINKPTRLPVHIAGT